VGDAVGSSSHVTIPQFFSADQATLWLRGSVDSSVPIDKQIASLTEVGAVYCDGRRVPARAVLSKFAAAGMRSDAGSGTSSF
jgi:hypothetical protein